MVRTALLAGALAAIVASSWARLEQPRPGLGELLLVASLAVAPALVRGRFRIVAVGDRDSGRRLRRPRRAAALGVALRRSRHRGLPRVPHVGGLSQLLRRDRAVRGHRAAVHARRAPDGRLRLLAGRGFGRRGSKAAPGAGRPAARRGVARDDAARRQRARARPADPRSRPGAARRGAPGTAEAALAGPRRRRRGRTGAHALGLRRRCEEPVRRLAELGLLQQARCAGRRLLRLACRLRRGQVPEQAHARAPGSRLVEGELLARHDARLLRRRPLGRGPDGRLPAGGR